MSAPHKNDTFLLVSRGIFQKASRQSSELMERICRYCHVEVDPQDEEIVAPCRCQTYMHRSCYQAFAKAVAGNHVDVSTLFGPPTIPLLTASFTECPQTHRLVITVPVH